MNTSKVIGAQNSSIIYTERPTVKALIINEIGKVLIINEGLLPGGGVEDHEDNVIALAREIIEEVDITVSDIHKLASVIQYRDFLKKKYIINGYTARYVDNSRQTLPQDEGEARFTYSWRSIEDAIKLVDFSINQTENTKALVDDAYQGKLFNLQTTRVLLDSFANRS